jgi:hypothetical protein
MTPMALLSGFASVRYNIMIGPLIVKMYSRASTLVLEFLLKIYSFYHP